jgi:hypothetical protein
VHRKFVAKRQQFDLSDERVTLAGREQPQQGGEGEIGKKRAASADPRRASLA